MQAGVLLLCWLCAVLAVQQLPAPWLLGVGVLLLLAALLAAPQRSRQLLRRIRVLALMIVILFAWFTPGEALWLPLIALAPSREGVELALQHLARLSIAVCALALLLEALPMARLLSGLYALSRPFAVFGLSPERFALRLMLVLRLVDVAPAVARRQDWRRWLAEDGLEPLSASEAACAIELEPLRVRDLLACSALVLAGLGWSLW